VSTGKIQKFRAASVSSPDGYKTEANTLFIILEKRAATSSIVDSFSYIRITNSIYVLSLNNGSLDRETAIEPLVQIPEIGRELPIREMWPSGHLLLQIGELSHR